MEQSKNGVKQKRKRIQPILVYSTKNGLQNMEPKKIYYRKLSDNDKVYNQWKEFLQLCKLYSIPIHQQNAHPT